MYGRMNLFHWKNIKDAQITLKIKPAKRFSTSVEFHKFWLAEDRDAWYLNAKEYRDKNGTSGDEVGRELNIMAKFDFSRKNQIQLGFGHFWPDEFAKKQASNKEANWVFLIGHNKFRKSMITVVCKDFHIKRWSTWKQEPDTPKNQMKNCKIKWKYDKPELLQRLRELKDNLKYLPKGVAPKVKADEVREEFNWLQYRHLREVFSHPLEESF